MNPEIVSLPEITLARLETSEAAALEDVFRAAPPPLTASLGLHAERDEGALVALTRATEAPALNRCLELGARAPASPEVLDRILERAECHGVRRFFVQPGPGARPAELPLWLERRGLVLHNHWMRMYRTLPAEVRAPDGVRVEHIGLERGIVFGELFAAGFDLPPALAPWIGALADRPLWSLYLAYDDGETAGTAALRCADGVAWLGLATTAPTHRRRGVQRALIAQRLADAAALGCREAHMETAEPRGDFLAPSFRNAAWAGFRLAYARPNYLWKAAPSDEVPTDV